METEASHEVKESGLAGNLTAAGVGAEVDFERQKSMFSFLCSSRGLVVVRRDLARSAAGILVPENDCRCCFDWRNAECTR